SAIDLGRQHRRSGMGALCWYPPRASQKPGAVQGLLDSRQPSSCEVYMRLIGLAVVLTVSLNLAQIAAEAQQAARIPRIGFLSASSPSSEDHPSGDPL